jgi:hypothetical protein
MSLGHFAGKYREAKGRPRRFLGVRKRAFTRLKFEGLWCGPQGARPRTHDGSVTRRARFAVMPDEQVLDEGIDGFVLQAVQFRIFMK